MAACKFKTKQLADYKLITSFKRIESTIKIYLQQYTSQ